MSTEDRVRRSLRISSHLAPEPPPIRRKPKPGRSGPAVALAVVAVVAAIGIPAGLVTLIHRQGAAPVTTQSASVSVSATVVPWLDRAAQPPVFAGGPPTARQCELSDLSVPRNGQKWNGAWQGATSGYFEIENSSDSSCQLDFPSKITANTSSGPRNVVFKTSPHESYVLPPRARVQVLLTSKPGCHRQTQASSFSLTIPAGELAVSPAPMYLDCPATVYSFEAPRALTEMLTPASYLEASIEAAPATGYRGNVITFQVTLTNPTTQPVVFDSCPVYQEALKGLAQSEAFYVLNCSGQPTIAPGASRTYAMQLSVPGHLPQASQISPGTGVMVHPSPSPVETYLQWHLMAPLDPANNSQLASVPIMIQ